MYQSGSRTVTKHCVFSVNNQSNSVELLSRCTLSTMEVDAMSLANAQNYREDLVAGIVHRRENLLPLFYI